MFRPQLKKRGKCLSTEYVNAKSKVLIECKHGHKWEPIAWNILNDKSWCPECNGGVVDTIDKFKKIALQKGGKCHSNFYGNQDSILEFECQKGHRWSTRAGQVSGGAWCHECGGSKPKTLEDMHKLAEQKGGKCLSKEFINVETHLIWQCNKKHTFRAKPGNVKTGHWCPHCGTINSGLNRRLDISVFQKIAAERGGKLISKEYHGQGVHLEWECSEEHRWSATPKNIKKGRWCPECALAKRKAA